MTMATIQNIIDGIIQKEGGYVNNKDDAGGVTMYGITEKVARASGYGGDMRNLPRDFAVAVYMRQYVTGPGFDKVVSASARIGEELVDTGVNMGPSIPGPWLQRVLNALGAELAVDGAIGPATISALRTVLLKRGADGEKVILRTLNGLQAARYLELTEKRPQNKTFFFGWILNRVEGVA